MAGDATQALLALEDGDLGAGAKVTIFERKESLGGVARHIIPAFRISDEDIDRDVELCRRCV